ncbi:uncharacterized protein LOC114526517 [Dendronephthya gigantea]|uniref:uncharacterized protein LOC114526517 n=1 Tax=Dendronephthya gigantea TaxID=151771 RepID=UPI00106C73ED|nr:uncharacterized protein LOC114526517 [Dendronephthya gigantea]
MVSVECQTDISGDDLDALQKEVESMKNDLNDMRSKALESAFSKQSFEASPDKTKFYTGLPNYLVLMQVFGLCEPFISTTSQSALNKFEQFILVLLRLRLNLPLKDLGYRFNVSLSTVSRIWHKVITVMHQRVKFLIDWPQREFLQATMPMDFRNAFGSKVVVIIDCFEVYIERPSNLLARAQTWSNYKHHNTVKFLIGISPQGLVSYISSAWGGRASDKRITEESGMLKKLLPDDVVLADRGFDIDDSVGFSCASLKIPAFTKGKPQLSPIEVEESRKVASVRIHVERVTGLVRQKYQILQSRAMPIEHMAVKDGDSLAVIDKIAVICCALSNLSESVVPLE